MADFLRALRLGIINLLGVTVPGLLVMSLFIAGFAAPVTLLLQDCMLAINPTLRIPELPQLPPVGTIPSLAISVLALMLAYIIGYIFRLSTPDDLDKVSGENVVKKMGGKQEATEDAWPYRGEKDNKFPYYYFKEYLETRGHKELLELVSWGPSDKGEFKRSKTLVNKMKIEIATLSPDLSATIESNEAHIRLLFGVWLTVKMCRPFVIIGIICSMVGVVFSTIVSGSKLAPNGIMASHPIWLIATFLLLIGCRWSKKQIEHMFHYRRVRELMDVVVCRFWARKCGEDRDG